MRPLLNSALLFFSAVVLLSFIACDRTSERDDDLETLTGRETALAYHIFDDAFREVHRFAMRDSLLNDTGIKQWFNGCISRATLSDTVAVFPLLLNLNYGDDGEVCDDGFKRYGNILATFTGKYLNKGTTISITFDDYRKDIFNVEGLLTIKNLGINSDGLMHYTWEVEGGHITGTNTDYTFEGEHTMVWTAGRSFDSEGIVDDDIFQLDGMAEGRNSRGSTFTNSITIPYVCDFSCQWFTKGHSYLEIPNLARRSINFGDGIDCDNIVTQRRTNTYLEFEIPY